MLRVALLADSHGFVDPRVAEVVVYGHSHRRVCDRGELPWVVNPGAAGRARTFGGPSLVVLTAGESAWQLETVHFPTPSSDRPTRRRSP